MKITFETINQNNCTQDYEVLFMQEKGGKFSVFSREIFDDNLFSKILDSRLSLLGKVDSVDYHCDSCLCRPNIYQIKTLICENYIYDKTDDNDNYFSSSILRIDVVND